ncbi:hypothetical protein ACUIJN_17310 [Metabacillus halosaccharovorans]|uniref:hypothetical protein n=1 Tax=Metabacillus halosaccharovorans TaxID=930124 RepID=UPI00203F3448|nr:hypothetical protein [Metabacillus halosaccharovorans]MCM3441395.1 hypothetical protein [Metabacillus halosaccharovorans]
MMKKLFGLIVGVLIAALMVTPNAQAATFKVPNGCSGCYQEVTFIKATRMGDDLGIEYKVRDIENSKTSDWYIGGGYLSNYFNETSYKAFSDNPITMAFGNAGLLPKTDVQNTPAPKPKPEPEPEPQPKPQPKPDTKPSSKPKEETSKPKQNTTTEESKTITTTKKEVTNTGSSNKQSNSSSNKSASNGETDKNQSTSNNSSNSNSSSKSSITETSKVVASANVNQDDEQNGTTDANEEDTTNSTEEDKPENELVLTKAINSEYEKFKKKNKDLHIEVKIYLALGELANNKEPLPNFSKEQIKELKEFLSSNSFKSLEKDEDFIYLSKKLTELENTKNNEIKEEINSNKDELPKENIESKEEEKGFFEKIGDSIASFFSSIFSIFG